MMLLILTVLGMGVPAMFAAERKSYVNQAMQQLIELNVKCQKLQRELAARGDAGIVKLTINFSTTKPDVTVSITGGTSGITPTVWFGRTFPISINADEFISDVSSSTGLGPTISWDYAQQSGFIQSVAPILLTFRAMPKGGSPMTYKVNRELTLYPQGYSEVP